MKLNKLLDNACYEIVKGDINKDINEINYDSRKVKNNDIFVCIKGYETDGHKYADAAIKKGASVIICEEEVESEEGITVIKVDNTRKALAIISSNFYGNPEKELKLYGITGTNGKTTSTFILKSILESKNYKVSLIGTIANYIGDKKLKAERTTPESLELFKLFRDMVKVGVTHCIMEVSSHSLELYRVNGIIFDAGIFTNLTQDHLDFHKTFENYFNAKKKLFQCSKESILNIDDKYGARLFKELEEGKNFTYSIENPSDLKAFDIKIHSRGVDFTISYKNEEEKIHLNIPGKYNVYNALGCILVALRNGFTLKEVKRGIEALIAVPGRCEIVSYRKNLDFDIIIDYAHTPDGVENILKTAREFTKARLISLVGCGGDRDRKKRPIMGKIASELSDIVVVTSDNPRSEDPKAIIDDIIVGINKKNYIIEVDRKEAIKYAIKEAINGDVIVIAGKGHEDYQVLKDKVIDFDERIIVDDILKELGLIK